MQDNKNVYVEIDEYNLYFKKNISFWSLFWFYTKYFFMLCFTKKIPVSGKKIETELSNELIEYKNNRDENEQLQNVNEKKNIRDELDKIHRQEWENENWILTDNRKNSRPWFDHKIDNNRRKELEARLKDLEIKMDNNRAKENEIKEIEDNAVTILAVRCLFFALIFTFILMICGIVFLYLDIFIFRVAIFMTVLFPIFCFSVLFAITAFASVLRDQIREPLLGLRDRELSISRIPSGFNVTNEIIPMSNHDKNDDVVTPNWLR